MSLVLRRPTLLSLLFVICIALPTLAQVSLPNDSGVKGDRQKSQAEPAAGNSVQLFLVDPQHHGVPWRDPQVGAVAPAAPAGAHLTYFGGPVVSNVHVVQVLYGSGSYAPQVSSTTTPSIASFFTDITNSTYMDMLSEYNTVGQSSGTQTIGHGTFDGQFTIVPAAANNGSTITDTQIQSELLAQINAAHLPSPILDGQGHVNTIYMIYFPPGKTITQGGSQSCVGGGFCAYHGTTSSTFQSNNLLYGVLPDMQAGSGCSTGCGNSTVFNNYTSVTSHELAEAITDADVGIATTFAAPLAWYDMTNGEIGDICNGQQATFVANGTTYTIQTEFSNAQANCITPPVAATPNFSLSASPANLTIALGASGVSTVRETPSGGFTGAVTLSASGLPSGVTAAFATNPTTSTSVVTFAASATATTGASTVTITGTSGTLTHTTTIVLTINSTSAQQLIGNPGFENATAAPWTLTPAVLNTSASQPPHSGTKDAWLDGYGTTHTDSAIQTVTIPSTAASATLTFWLHIDSAETTTTTASDTLNVQVLNSAGTVLSTLGTFSNLNKATGYSQKSFNMIAFKGQTVQIRFLGVENNRLQTSFVLDDVNLNVQ